jgi:hypothetical protein
LLRRASSSPRDPSIESLVEERCEATRLETTAAIRSFRGFVRLNHRKSVIPDLIRDLILDRRCKIAGQARND